MTGMMLYVSLGLMVLTVLSNRFWRRQLLIARASQSKVKDIVDDVTKEVAEVASSYAELAHLHAETEKRVAKAEQDLQTALLDLERKKEAPVKRYYVFDRLEPRQGRFWEVAIRCTPGKTPPRDRQAHRVWTGIRHYVLVADSENDVRERIGARFPRKAGYDLVEVAPCRLNRLVVNRIAELSTFRKPGSSEEEPGRPRRTAVPS